MLIESRFLSCHCWKVIDSWFRVYKEPRTIHCVSHSHFNHILRKLCIAARKALDKIPTKSIALNDLANVVTGEFVECCAICIEQYRIRDTVRILPCKHVFHKTCVDPWLLDQRSCPMCKLDILNHYGLIEA
ncbi:E3 ubiquitin-protein ligase goliath-like isoform X2 [Brevipalpus obovatus]|uniref:E3 ubiquitin-protein ligase goliath-like isoform X2 n=1 Tax=Brevipalpus obovatus TaxID=246614 RepID=UPI003D9DC355